MAYTTINDPSTYFHTQLYTGDGQASKTVTNDANAGNFKPDWIWVKNRDDTDSHMISDSSRGSTKAITSNSDGAEFTPTNGNLAFLTDGFSFGSNNNYNRSSDKFVAWQWKANGGTTASNSDGSITSTVQANTTAGFSIVTYTGTGATATVGHGLGTTPNVIIAKNLTNTGGAASWPVYHHKMGNTHYMKLDTDAAQIDSSGLWNDTSPTSSVFTINTSHQINASGGSFVAYCFTEIQGFSRFRIFKGTGDATDGAFVYCGFKPAYIMMKKTTDSSGANWGLFDIKREGYNSLNQDLRANTTSAEGSDADILDITSTGFKIRSTSGGFGGGDGSDYIYLAFAKQPLVATNTICNTTRINNV